MIHKTSKPDALDRHEINYPCMMVSYGPVVAIGVIATLCVGAVLIIYRRYARGQGKSSAPTRKQTEDISSEGSRCGKSPENLKECAEVKNSHENHTEEPRNSVPSGDQCVDSCAATVDEVDHPLANDCFSSPVPELQEYVKKHLINEEEYVGIHTEDCVQKHLDNDEEPTSSHGEDHAQKHLDNDEEPTSSHGEDHAQKHLDNDEEPTSSHGEDHAQKHLDNDEERASAHSDNHVQKPLINHEEHTSTHSDDRVQKHLINDEHVSARAEHHGHTGNGHKHVSDCQEQVSRNEDHAPDHDEHLGEDHEYFSHHHENLGDYQGHLSARHDYVSNPSEVQDTDVKTEQMVEDRLASMTGQLEDGGKTVDTNVNEVATSDHHEHDMIDAEVGSWNVAESLGISMAGEPEQENESMITMINVQEIPSCLKHPSNLLKDKDAEVGHDKNVDDLEGNVIGQMQDSYGQSELIIMEATMDDDKWLNAGCTEDNSGRGNAEVERWPMVQSAGPGHANSESLKKPCATHASLDGDPISKRVVAVQPMPQSVRVSFRIHYVTDSSSQRLAVTGSLQELGGWENLSRSLKPRMDFGSTPSPSR
ncbi:hypothetical protein AAFF_G00425730 [Aldrovandia affinis]|uniref:CBM20 domain-containing protein n=1 Tax=Aldrovandia affinis TaxID=143900 RepID=A0AAD7T829_9TELE|nr:hypothetical protein AAFF_G00425730 [Aldrovandia affinis]